MRTLRDELIQFILSGGPSEARISSDQQDLFEGGYLDSMAFLKLLTFLEKRYGLKIPPRDSVFEHFSSVERIIETIHRLGAKTQAGPSANG